MVREEKAFTLRFTLEAEFPDDYEGDEDEHKWVKEWEQDLKPALLKVIFDSLRKHSSWKAHIRNRGASPLDEIEIALVKSFEDKKTGSNPDTQGGQTPYWSR